MMDPVPLDPELVARFKDKTMAIVGYETDQAISYKQLILSPLYYCKLTIR